MESLSCEKQSLMLSKTHFKENEERNTKTKFIQRHQREDVDAPLGLSPNFIPTDFSLLDFKYVDSQTISKKEHMEN